MISTIITAAPALFHLLIIASFLWFVFLFFHYQYQSKTLTKENKDLAAQSKHAQAMLDAETQKPRTKEQITDVLNKGEF